MPKPRLLASVEHTSEFDYFVHSKHRCSIHNGLTSALCCVSLLPAGRGRDAVWFVQLPKYFPVLLAAGVENQRSCEDSCAGRFNPSLMPRSPAGVGWLQQRGHTLWLQLWGVLFASESSNPGEVNFFFFFFFFIKRLNVDLGLVGYSFGASFSRPRVQTQVKSTFFFFFKET